MEREEGKTGSCGRSLKPETLFGQPVLLPFIQSLVTLAQNGTPVVIAH